MAHTARSIAVLSTMLAVAYGCSGGGPEGTETTSEATHRGHAHGGADAGAIVDAAPPPPDAGTEAGGDASTSSAWITGFYSEFWAGSVRGQTLADVPWSKYTHLVHSGTFPIAADCSLSTDPNYGAVTPAAADAFVAAARAAGVRALLAVAGNYWDASAFGACTQPGTVQSFANAIATFVAAHGYDGVDLDWEAGIEGGPYADLIGRIHAAIPSALVTMDVYTDANYLHAIHDTAGIVRQVNVMCYDMDAWSTQLTWYNDALLDRTADGNGSCDQEMAYFTSGGGNTVYGIQGDPTLAVPASLLGVGVPFYGRKFTPATGPSQAGSFAVSVVSYYELAGDPVRFQPSNMVWDAEHGAQYLRVTQVTPNEFIAYTGVEQIGAAVALMSSNGYGGMMAFSLDQEYTPTASGDARWPLSSALSQAVRAAP